MTAPTFVASYSSSYSSTASPKTVSVTTLPGDVLVVYGGAENGSGGLTTPSGNSISFNLEQSVTLGVNWASAYIWTGTDTTGGTSWTLSCTNGTSQQWGFTCVVFRNSGGIGGSGATSSAAGLPVVNNITTVSDNSAVVVFNSDWNAQDGSGRTWNTINSITPTSGNGLELDYYFGNSVYTAYGAYYSDVGVAGSPTPGLSAPSSQKWSIVAVEVKGISPSVTTISDNFNDNTTNVGLWYSYATTGSFAETNGQLAVTLASNNPGYGGYTSLGTYNLTGSQVSVEFIQGVDASSGCEQGLGVYVDSNYGAYFMIGGAYLIFRLTTAGVTNDTYFARDDANIRWWRIRESSGTLYWETSPNSNVWTTQHSASSTFAVTDLKIALYAGTWQNVASPGVAIFDNFNTMANIAPTAWLRA